MILTGLLLLTGLSVLIIGYDYAQGDMAFYVPLIRRAIDPTLFRNDWWVSQVEGFHHGFVNGMAFLGRHLGVEQAFFLAHCLERLGLVTAIYFLARALGSGRLGALLAVIVALFADHWQLGGYPLATAITNPNTFALPPALFAILLAVRGFPLGAALLAVLTTYIHALLGAELMLLLLLAAGLDRAISPRVRWGAAAIYAAASAPVLWPEALRQLAVSSPLPGADYLTIAAFRSPWHHFPLSWPLADYCEFFVYFLGGVLAFVLARERPDPRGGRRILVISWGIAVLCVIGVAFVEWLPTPLVAKLLLFRLTLFVRVFVAIALGHYLANAIRTSAIWHAPLFLLALLKIHNPHLFGLFFGLALAVELGSRRFTPLPAGLFLGYLAALGALYAAAPEGWSVGHMGTRLLLLAVVGLGGVAGWRILAARETPLRACALGVLAVILLFVDLRVPKDRMSREALLAAGSGRVKMTLTVESDWDRLCRWARENTSKDALFMTPPYRNDFRLRAGRGIVGDCKGSVFREEHAGEWMARLRDLAGKRRFSPGGDCFRELRAGYDGMTGEELLAVAFKYGAEYIVVEKPRLLRLPLAFENATYAVYSGGSR